LYLLYDLTLFTAWALIQKQFLSGVYVSVLANIAKKYPIINAPEISAPNPRTLEDCLFLDVIVLVSIYNSTYVRQKRGEVSVQKWNSTGTPALVWIYGGAYVGGGKSGTDNPASLLARN
jgi:acetyl esterase/lipase